MRDRALKTKPAVTSRDVIRAIALDHPGTLRVLRARSRSLTAAGVLPKGKGGRAGGGAAPWTLRHATLLILSTAVGEAISAPQEITRIAGLKRDDGESLADHLESAMEFRRRIVIGETKARPEHHLHHVVIYAGQRGEYFADITWSPESTDDEGYSDGFNLGAGPDGLLDMPPDPICRATMIRGDVFRRIATLYGQGARAATKARAAMRHRRRPKAAR